MIQTLFLQMEALKPYTTTFVFNQGNLEVFLSTIRMIIAKVTILKLVPLHTKWFDSVYGGRGTYCL